MVLRRNAIFFLYIYLGFAKLHPSQMKKYIQYLLADIEDLIEQAPTPLHRNELHDDPEDTYLDIPLRYVKISDLIGLKTEVFPPEHFLCDLHVIQLMEAINDLWSAWQLEWYVPPNVPLRSEYTTLVKQIEGNPISYHPEEGGEVVLCNILSSQPCTFESLNGQCFCKKLEEERRQEVLLWEEYIRSQGLDPDQEITSEEEALFEADMKHRRNVKEKFPFEIEFSEEDQKELLKALEIIDGILSHFDKPLDEFDILEDDEQEDIEFPF